MAAACSGLTRGTPKGASATPAMMARAHQRRPPFLAFTPPFSIRAGVVSCITCGSIVIASPPQPESLARDRLLRHRGSHAGSGVDPHLRGHPAQAWHAGVD